MAFRRNGTKLASRSCILQRESVLWEQTSAPMHLCSGAQCLPSSQLPIRPRMVSDAYGFMGTASWQLVSTA